jgi:hypothetical protein
MGSRWASRVLAACVDPEWGAEDVRAAVPVPESETALGLPPPSWLIISDAVRADAAEGVN